jgi:hypothetical protein
MLLFMTEEGVFPFYTFVVSWFLVKAKKLRLYVHLWKHLLSLSSTCKYKNWDGYSLFLCFTSVILYLNISPTCTCKYRKFKNLRLEWPTFKFTIQLSNLPSWIVNLFYKCLSLNLTTKLALQGSKIEQF